MRYHDLASKSVTEKSARAYNSIATQEENVERECGEMAIELRCNVNRSRTLGKRS